MKMFILTIVIAIILGGFVGGEIMGNSFSITGAVIGGVSTFSVLMGLGAFFDYQDRKKKQNLSPEMKEVFDRMIGKNTNEYGNKFQPQAKKEPLNLSHTINNLLAEDFEYIKRGETPERRLIPHFAIKRDIILLGYEKDFLSLSDNMQKLNKTDYDNTIYAIKRLSPEELDKILEMRKKSHGDLMELELRARRITTLYQIVPPIFIGKE